LSLEDVIGALDLQRAREAAQALGMRVVGVRVERASEPPIDGVRVAPTTSSRRPGNRPGTVAALSSRLFKRAWPSPPAWAERPTQFSAYPSEWERGLLRFVVAFEEKAAGERATLAALGLPVPKQVSRYLIEPVGVEAWITYVGQFRFSSLDVTPPKFEIAPHVAFVADPEPSPSTGGRSGGGFVGGPVTSTLDGAGAAGRPATHQHWVSRDPYAFYKLLNGNYVYHLYERGLEADFEKYWLTKFEPLVVRKAS
jgi:hypothetical protein